MSGHAGKALVLRSDRGRLKAKTIFSLGETTPPGQGKSPFPLDHYLSWMSLVPFVTRSFVTRSLKKFLRLQLVESAFCVVALPGNACTLFVSALWRHHLLVLTEERKEKKIA
jgi:hypothetical protein